MIGIGRFLEFSAPVDDITSSLAFYAGLGFAEISVGDIRGWQYGVVTDGHVAIGLHGGGRDEPCLSFVHPDLARYARDLVDAGTEFEFQRLGPEEFNEVGLRSPDGLLLNICEAPTFSQAQINAAAESLVGVFRCIDLSCNRIQRARAFWEKAGLVADEDPADGTLELYSTAMTFRLREDLKGGGPVLHFKTGDLDQVLNKLRESNIRFRPAAGGYMLTAPEGTRLLLTD